MSAAPALFSACAMFMKTDESRSVVLRGGRGGRKAYASQLTGWAALHLLAPRHGPSVQDSALVSFQILRSARFSVQRDVVAVGYTVIVIGVLMHEGAS